MSNVVRREWAARADALEDFADSLAACRHEHEHPGPYFAELARDIAEAYRAAERRQVGLVRRLVDAWAWWLHPLQAYDAAHEYEETDD